MEQASLFGMDGDGLRTAHGDRLVYVFEEYDGDVSTKRLKVGYTGTGDPMNRRPKLQTGNSRRLQYVGAFAVQSQHDERRTLDQLARYKIHGGGDEWFRRTSGSMFILDRLMNPLTVVRDAVVSTGEWIVPFDCPSCKGSMFTVITTVGYSTGRSTLGLSATCSRCTKQFPLYIVVDHKAEAA